MGKFLDEKTNVCKAVLTSFFQGVVACVAYSLTFQADVSQEVSNHAAELYNRL